MAKSSGKKIRNEGQDAGRSTAKKYFKKLKNNKSTDVVCSAENGVTGPVVDGSGFIVQKTEEFSGFIFMCNGKTKPECYVNRVFGLPSGKREVVEKIKPGMKLFLFDFDVKLLYGVYEASSSGAMNLEPTAFGERFPAQVRFKIYKDCLPMHFNSFRNAIKDNCQGSKFAPELNGQQVINLLSLFRPIVLPSPSVSPYGAPQLRGMPPPPINGQLNPSLSPPLQTSYRPYVAGQSHILPQQAMRPRSVPQNVLNPHLHHLHSAPGNTYQFAETRQPYPRYTTTPEVYPHGQPVNGAAIQTQGEAFLNHADSYRYHHFHPMPTAAYVNTPQRCYSVPDPSHVNTAPPCYSLPGSSHVNTTPCYSVPDPSHVNTPPPCYSLPGSSHVNTTPCYSVPDPSYVNTPPCYYGPDPSHVNAPPCYYGPDPSLVNTPPCYGGPT